jgi:hypothetical protein
MFFFVGKQIWTKGNTHYKVNIASTEMWFLQDKVCVSWCQVFVQSTRMTLKTSFKRRCSKICQMTPMLKITTMFRWDRYFGQLFSVCWENLISGTICLNATILIGRSKKWKFGRKMVDNMCPHKICRANYEFEIT